MCQRCFRGVSEMFQFSAGKSTSASLGSGDTCAACSQVEARSLGWLALAQVVAPRTPIENFIESHTPTKAKVYRQTPRAARRQATPQRHQASPPPGDNPGASHDPQQRGA